MTNKVLWLIVLMASACILGKLWKQHSVSETDHTKYHDDTYLKLKKSNFDKVPIIC
jgi:hypothetical protein